MLSLKLGTVVLTYLIKDMKIITLMTAACDQRRTNSKNNVNVHDGRRYHNNKNVDVDDGSALSKN